MREALRDHDVEENIAAILHALRTSRDRLDP
jgi:hypothetical protein